MTGVRTAHTADLDAAALSAARALLDAAPAVPAGGPGGHRSRKPGAWPILSGCPADHVRSPGDRRGL